MHRRPAWISRFVGLALAAGCVALAPVWPSSIVARADDDDDEREVRRVEAQRSFVENCLMCHAEDMTTRQRLTARQWTAEVEKMVGWGAPLPPDRKQPLIDHLVELYPATKTAPGVERIAPEQAQALDPQPLPIRPIEGADPNRGVALFNTHCAACHGPAAKGGELGTNLVEKPSLVREAEFRALMKDGRRRMPGFAAVLDDRASGDLLTWLRNQKWTGVP